MSKATSPTISQHCVYGELRDFYPPPLSRQAAQQLNEQRRHVALDFSQTWLTFRLEGKGAPAGFKLYGDADVTVADRDRKHSPPPSSICRPLVLPLMSRFNAN